jgi:mannosyl-oligosaccharide alpha-1,2-mannosidase
VVLFLICLTLYINTPFHSFGSTPSYAGGRVRIQHSFGHPTNSQQKTQQQRLDAVRAEFLHSWRGYKEHAWLKDELRPLSGGNADKFCGWAATAVDSLDTLLIMGLEDEYKKTVEATYDVKFIDLDHECIINLFETTIRHLGGMMAAYDLDGRKDKKLYAKIIEIGEVLYASFDTHNGMPSPHYPWPK